MATLHKLEFFLLRYVPDAVKDEFANIGVVMLGDGFGDVRFTKDWRRVYCLDGDADVEMLEALERDIRVQLQEASNRDVFLNKIKEAFSNLVQLSPTRGCLAENPIEEMTVLSRMYLESRTVEGAARVRIAASERQRIWQGMQRSFQEAGVWELMLKDISVAPYTGAGDPLKIDFGYRVGREIKLFHAVSLKRNIEAAISLAHRFPKIVAGISRVEKAEAQLTAVGREYDPRVQQVEFALSEFAENGVGVMPLERMGEIAGLARMELRA
ncbi:MAG TPA: DUF3037 domain-containing protein [Terriglobales bacterium]|jgi:hypothetical protein|nr:DUF3037 domain-containing protein [Terriglobales bacterium]